MASPLVFSLMESQEAVHQALIPITLIRHSMMEPFGFTLETDDFVRKHWIKDTKEYGLAHDLLKPGDWICTVNGIEASDLTHEQIFEQCGAMNTMVTLMVAREAEIPPNADEDAQRLSITVSRSFPEESVGFVINHHNSSPGRYTHVVGRITPGSLGASAGISAGDVIISINGIMVHNQEDDFALAQVAGCQNIRFVVDRIPSGERNIPLRQLCPVEEKQKEAAQVQLNIVRDSPSEPWGLTVQSADEISQHLIVDVAPGSPAAAAGVHPGDVVLALGNAVIDGAGMSHEEVLGLFDQVSFPPSSMVVERLQDAVARSGELILSLERGNFHEELGFVFGTLEGMKIVASVDDNTPASRAGVCPNDLVVGVNGVPTENVTDDQFLAAIALRISPTFQVFRERGAHGMLRAGATVDLTELVQDAREEIQQTPDGQKIVEEVGPYFPVSLGFVLSTEEDQTNVVEDIKEGSIIARSGILIGDQIMSINGTCIIGMPHDEVIGLLHGQHFLRISIERDTRGMHASVDTIHITRHSQEESWGFVMESMDGASVVIKVHKDTLADHAGLIPGDVIKGIAGIKTETLTHEQIMARLKWPVDNVTLSVERRNKEPERMAAEATVQEATELKTLVVERKVGQSWGFTVQSDTYDIPNGPPLTKCHVGKIFPSTPAEKAGLVAWDQLVAINEQRLDVMLHEQIVEMVGAKDVTELKVMVERVKSGSTMAFKQMRITRTALGDSLGFSMSSCAKTGHITTDEVVPGSLAHQAGLLPDDRLLAVNNRELHMGVTHNEIVAWLGEVQTVDLHIERAVYDDEEADVEIIRLTIREDDDQMVEKLGCTLETDLGRHVVDSITPGGLAARSALAKNDRILMIDDADVVSAGHDEVKSLLGVCTHLTIARRTTHGSKTPRYMVQVARDSEEEGNGLKIQKLEGEDIMNKYVVGGLKPGGYAEVAGLLVDDIILAINGESLHDKTDLNEVTAMTKQHLTTAFIIERPSEEADDDADDEAFPDDGGSAEPSNVYTLERGSTEEMLGFQFNTMYEVDKKGEFKHIISEIVPDSAADDAGLIVGDEIIEVDDVSTLREDHDPVVHMLKTSQSPQVKIHRHAATQLHRVSWLPTLSGKEHVQQDPADYTPPIAAQPAHSRMVSLEREGVDETYGFMCETIEGYPYPRIFDVTEGSLADGHVRVGDIILNINDTFVEDMSHDEVITLLKQHELSVEMEISRESQLVSMQITRSSYNVPWGIFLGQIEDGSHIVTEVQYQSPATAVLHEFDKLIAVNEMMTHDHDELIQEMISHNILDIVVERPLEQRRNSLSIDNGAVETGTLMVVTLQRDDVDTPWGIKLAEEVHPDNTYSHVVHGTKAGTPSDGELQFGDQIHTINGEKAQAKSHNEVVEAIKSATTVVLQVSRGEHSAPKFCQVEVVISRLDTGRSWGITLAEMVDHGPVSGNGACSHEISAVAPDSVASAQVLVHDTLHSINGNLTVDMDHDGIVAIMTTATTMALVLNRPVGDVEPMLVRATLERPSMDSAWGLVIGELQTGVDDNVHHQITEVRTDSPCQGIVHVHDRLATVNGSPAAEMTHEEVLAVFSSKVRVDVELIRSGESFEYVQPNQTKDVEVSRENLTSPWGIDIESEPDHSFHEIASVDGASPFFGKAEAGDKILTVNGVTAPGMPHDDLLQIMVDATELQLQLAPADAKNAGTAIVKVEGSRNTTSTPWGIDLASDDGGCHVIQSVVSTSPFYEQLFPEDQIMSIDGTSVANIGHDQVKDMMTTATALVIAVSRAGAPGSVVRTLVHADVERASTSAKWGVDISSTDDGVHEVTHVKAESPFTGKLQAGDRLVLIDDVEVQQIDHDGLLNLMVGATAMKVVASRSSAPELLDEWEIVPAQTSIELKRPTTDTSWGLDIAEMGANDGGDSATIFQVINVMPASPSFGKSLASDIILEINGTSVAGLSHDGMIALVKQAGLTLTLSVERMDAGARKMWQENDLTFADAIDTLEAHGATAETSFPSEAPDTAAEVEFLSKVAEDATAAPASAESAEVEAIVAPSYEEVTATATTDEAAGYLQVGMDTVPAVAVQADEEESNLSSFGVAEETETADDSMSTFPTEDADTGDDEETEAFAASPVDLATLKASEGIAARATTFAVANAFVQIDANKAEAEAGSVPFGGAGEAADEAPRADAGDRIDATPPPPPPAQAPTNFAPSPQVKVPPPVAAKKSKASVPTASGVKQKLAERRSELGPDSPAGSPSMIRPASSIKSRLADKRRSDLDHSIHGESARSIDQAAADAKAAQAVEVVGAKTRVLEGQASELAPVVSPEQVDPEKRENVRNSFLSTFGLAEDDDDDDDA